MSSGDHPWLADLTERSRDRISGFKEQPFPKTWDDFPGVGPVAAATFEALNIKNPAMLLGKFLSTGPSGKDVPEFYSWLSSNGIPTPRVLCLQLLSWCATHDLYVPGE
eukprot:EC786999.1.p1 GENE.EC786999.1~~EC786999.1.p1  ORF type:complete len:108 (+),score=15.23 EC786999.1:64-387(+)